MEPFRLSIPPSLSDSRQHAMRLLKNLFSRLSDSLLVSVPSRIRRARFCLCSVLRLVSSKPDAPASDGAKRAPSHTTGQLEALEGHPEESGGFWPGGMLPKVLGIELEADTTLSSEYLMLRRFANCVDPERERKVIRYLKSALPCGAGLFITGAGGYQRFRESVLCLEAFRRLGRWSRSWPRREPASSIRAGSSRPTYVHKIALALFGQYDWRGVPQHAAGNHAACQRFYFSIYAISYWSRAVLIPLLIIFAKRPQCYVPPNRASTSCTQAPGEIDFNTVPPFKKDRTWFTARNFSSISTRVLKVYDRSPVEWVRQKALKWRRELDARSYEGAAVASARFIPPWPIR